MFKNQILPPLKIRDLSIRLPIFQGGMGVGISMASLASAVAATGAAGVIAAAGVSYLESDQGTNYREANIRALRQQITTARARTDGVLGVNIMTALTNCVELARVAVEEKIDIIISGAGLPMNLPECRSDGGNTCLVPVVSSARAVAVLCRRWADRFDCLPDAVVVEGPLAGGHLGFKPEQIEDPNFALEQLLKEVLATTEKVESRYGVRVPVIAAGGIYSGADIKRMLSLGAAGVQMGTRFVTTHECDAAMAFKQAYINAKAEDLVIIKSPVGLPGRAIRNDFTEAFREGRKTAYTCPFHCIITCDEKNSPYCIAQALLNASRGNFRGGFAFAGSNAWRAVEIISVQETINRICCEYTQSA